MSHYEKISCRIAIQVCVGHFPDGRKRHRTFSMRNINPDASLEAIGAVIRALAPVLAYPITKVRKVTKREIFFYEDAVMPVPQDNVASIPEARRVIPFPVPMRLTARKASSMMPPLRIGPPSKQAHFILERAPPGLNDYVYFTGNSLMSPHMELKEITSSGNMPNSKTSSAA